jgi:hypothetical protein
MTGFALGARQRVFLMRFGVQEYREILADRLVALRDHIVWRGTDDDPIHILDRQAQHFIADCAANAVNLHDLTCFDFYMVMGLIVASGPQ